MSSRMDANHEGPEFWSLLGPEWSDSKVQSCAEPQSRAHLRRLLQQQSTRGLKLAAGFLKRGTVATLTREHLHGALIYTRGDIKNDPPCKRCASPETAIFPDCWSLSGKRAIGACAADVWAGTTTECDYHKKNQESTVPDLRETAAATRIEETDSEDEPIVIAEPKRFRNVQNQAGEPGDVIDGQPAHNLTLRPRHLRASQASVMGGGQAQSTELVQIEGEAETGSRNPARTGGMFSPELGSNSCFNKKRNYDHITESPEKDNTADSGQQARRSRPSESIRDDLAYLQGNFDYAAVERAIEITPDMKQEAKSERMIQVGPYMLGRFVVETDGMWASRIAAARRAWSVKMGENTD